MYAAKKYQLPNLLTECQKILQTNISIDTVCIIPGQAVYFTEQELINKTVQFIGQHTGKVFYTEGFLRLSLASLRDIISSDWLEIDEVSVFEACIRWAKAELKMLINNPT